MADAGQPERALRNAADRDDAAPAGELGDERAGRDLACVGGRFDDGSPARWGCVGTAFQSSTFVRAELGHTMDDGRGRLGRPTPRQLALEVNGRPEMRAPRTCGLADEQHAGAGSGGEAVAAAATGGRLSHRDRRKVSPIRASASLMTMSDIDIRTLTDGGQTAEAVAGWIAEFIRGAQRTLDLAQYDFHLGAETAPIVAAAFADAVARAVAIRIVYDVDSAIPVPVPPLPEPDTRHRVARSPVARNRRRPT